MQCHLSAFKCVKFGLEDDECKNQDAHEEIVLYDRALKKEGRRWDGICFQNPKYVFISENE
jgi:hypothetical protein